MTINIADNSPRVSYDVAEGVTQSSFTVSFEFFDNDDLNVYVDGTLKTLTTDYTVTGGDGSTGTVTMSVTGATDGSTVVITRDIDLERTTDFPASGAFNIATLNTELDRLIAIAADLDDRAARALQLTDFDAAADLTLPDLDTRKGTVLAFNSTTGAVESGPKTTNVNQLADIADDVDTVAGISANVTTVAGISGNVTTVAGVSSDVTTVAGISANVTTVADNDANVTTVAGNDSNITTVAGISSDVTTVAGISSNVTTVAGDSADIQALAAKSTEIGLLGTADAIADMNTLATSAIVTDLDALADLATEIDALGDVTSDITTVSGISANVTSVAGNATNINTVAGVSSDVTTVAGISSDVTSVAGDAADIGTVAGISANVTSVAGISANVTTVAGISSNVTTVAGDSANIGTVAGISADITSVAGNQTNINTVAGNNSNITTVATNDANITTVATNITGVNSFAERYRVAASDPTTSLDEGDLAYNSTANILKYYNGTSWQSISPGIGSVADDSAPQLGGNLDVNGNEITSASNGNVVLNPDGTGQIQLNSTTVVQDGAHDFDVASHDGTNGLKLGGTLVTATAAKINYLDITTLGTSEASKVVTADASNDVSLGNDLSVSGNITVTGTVDGRDIATNIPSSLGTAGQVLTVNSGATAAEWADAATGGGGSAFSAF